MRDRHVVGRLGKLSDRIRREALLLIGLHVLIGADLFLATATHWSGALAGVALLFANVIAGLLWDRLSAPATFCAGAAICLVTLAALYGARSNRQAGV